MVVAGYALAGNQRKMMILAGLFYIVALLLYIPFEYEYWQPVRVGKWILSVEDVMLLFILGSVPWAVVSAVFRGKMRMSFKWEILLKRYVLMGLLAVCLFLLLWFLGMQAITASIIAQSIMSLLMLTFRFDLWPLAAAGLLIWPPVYLLMLKLTFWIFPDFRFVWNMQNFWCTPILGLPLGEILWSYSGAVGYVVALGYVFNVRLTESCPIEVTNKSFYEDIKDG